jgi:DNA-binding response OmpR family regulator
MIPDSGGTRQAGARLRLPTRPPLSVLFVDPDMRRAEQLARLLPQPTSAAHAPSAEAAFQAMSHLLPDLVVTRLDLPGLSGVDFIAHLHHTPATRHVLVMVVSERSTIREKIAALMAGADEFIVSPLADDTFTIRVQLLSRFRPQLGR